jgi:hypothetical protein
VWYVATLGQRSISKTISVWVKIAVTYLSREVTENHVNIPHWTPNSSQTQVLFSVPCNVPIVLQSRRRKWHGREVGMKRDNGLNQLISYFFSNLMKPIIVWIKKCPLKVHVLRACMLNDGHSRSDWLMRALSSTMDYSVNKFIAEWTGGRWSLVGGSRSLGMCLWMSLAPSSLSLCCRVTTRAAFLWHVLPPRGSISPHTGPKATEQNDHGLKSLKP